MERHEEGILNNGERLISQCDQNYERTFNGYFQPKNRLRHYETGDRIKSPRSKGV